MRIPSLLRELPAYVGASAVAFAVDFAILAALVNLAGLRVLLAAAISFVAGGVVLYFLSVRFVFRFRRLSNGAVELPLFVVLGLAGLAVNLAVMHVVSELAHIHFLVAKMGAAVCTFGINFALRRALLFTPLAATPRARGVVE
jgi:putative flippase GtrA